MEKFFSFTGTTYRFTEHFQELPDFLLKQITRALGIDFGKEKFIAAGWIQHMLSKGKIFVLVTDQRVAYSDTIRVKQNLFKDMTGVERNMMKNIILLSPGNSTSLFPSLGMPTSKFLDRMFGIINKTWMNTRRPVAESPAASSAGIIEQIDQLNDLKVKGILTEEEFQSKKKELLAKL
jgi:hypothetical protein